MFKVNNKNTRTFPAEQLHLLRSGVLIVILWTYLTPCSSVFIVNFEHVIAGCVIMIIYTISYKKTDRWLLRVLRVDIQVLRVDRRVLQMNKRMDRLALREAKRVLWVDKRVLRVEKRVKRVLRVVERVLWVTRRLLQVTRWVLR